MKRAYHSISEGWFSIFSRPSSNRFTRVQRCTCCFVLLFTSMLLNILYYHQTQEANSKNTNQTGLSFAPLYITFEQIFPLKILSLAIFFACFIRMSDTDEEAAEYLDDNTNDDEEYLHSIKVCF